MISIGDRIPDLELESSGGGFVRLSDFAARGKRLALFFYPKDSTSG